MIHCLAAQSILPQDELPSRMKGKSSPESYLEQAQPSVRPPSFSASTLSQTTPSQIILPQSDTNEKQTDDEFASPKNDSSKSEVANDDESYVGTFILAYSVLFLGSIAPRATFGTLRLLFEGHIFTDGNQRRKRAFLIYSAVAFFAPLVSIAITKMIPELSYDWFCLFILMSIILTTSDENAYKRSTMANERQRDEENIELDSIVSGDEN